MERYNTHKKFRFWNAETGKMLYYGFTIDGDGKVRVGDEPNWTRGFLMVSTNLKNKKGETIWEFDILKHKSFGYDIVVFEGGGFVSKDALLEGTGTGGSLWVNREIHEESITEGNIFEHPALLQKLLV